MSTKDESIERWRDKLEMIFRVEEMNGPVDRHPPPPVKSRASDNTEVLDPFAAGLEEQCFGCGKRVKEGDPAVTCRCEPLTEDDRLDANLGQLFCTPECHGCAHDLMDDPRVDDEPF